MTCESVFVYVEYIAAVDRWMSVLYQYIKPYLYANGGPIIMVQVQMIGFVCIEVELDFQGFHSWYPSPADVE